jgi:SAM-dependent methyltransferase
MLHKVIPASLKNLARRQLRKLLQDELTDTLTDLLIYRDGFFPHAPTAKAAVVPRVPPAAQNDPETGLPVPPQELWAGYGSTLEFYLYGKHDIRTMRDITARDGLPLEEAGRILDLGCSAGRMIRWLHDLADRCEIWGTDITATHINWCKQYLSPPFHFATTTTHPHLPFEDRYFGFIYCGSVFTHIDDLADSWFLELRRVLRPGGRLYVTIHDKHTVEVLRREPGHVLAGYLATRPEYAAHAAADFGMLSVKGNDWTKVYVFYDVDYLTKRLAPRYRVLSVNPEAYGYQTALLLERM